MLLQDFLIPEKEETDHSEALEVLFVKLIYYFNNY